MENINELYADLAERAKNLDWYYQYSDDYNVYLRGDKHYTEFVNDFKRLHEMDADMAAKFHDEFVPKNFNLLK